MQTYGEITYLNNQIVYTINHQRPAPHSGSCSGASGESESVTEWVTPPACVAAGTITTCAGEEYLQQLIGGKYIPQVQGAKFRTSISILLADVVHVHIYLEGTVYSILFISH